MTRPATSRTATEPTASTENLGTIGGGQRPPAGTGQDQGQEHEAEPSCPDRTRQDVEQVHRERERARRIGMTSRWQRPRQPDGERQQPARVHTREGDERKTRREACSYEPDLAEARVEDRPEDVPAERVAEAEASCAGSLEDDPHERRPPRARARARQDAVQRRPAPASRSRRKTPKSATAPPTQARRSAKPRKRVTVKPTLTSLGTSSSFSSWSMTPLVSLFDLTEKTNAPCSGCESAETIRQATVYVPRASGRSSSSIATVCASGREVRPESTRSASES